MRSSATESAGGRKGGGCWLGIAVVDAFAVVQVMGVVETGEEATLKLGGGCGCVVELGRTALKLRKPEGDDGPAVVVA